MKLLCLVPCALSLASVQDERPDAESLVELGWRLVPAYSGDHREALPSATAAEVEAGAHVFEAAIALDPEHLRALWSLGHAHVLLAANADHRGRDDDVRHHRRAAEQALTRAIELDATDPWAWYERGALRVEHGELRAAHDDLSRAVEAAEARIVETGPDGSEAWLRFKALQRTPEASMRAGQFDVARTELRAFHDEFSNNSFPLEIALAESHLRERDFTAAASAYERITQAFPDDPQAYAFLGYLAGLMNDRAGATERLQQAIRLEREPGFYTRLWLWILATDDARPAAEADLRAFLEYPPSSSTAWDLGLGRYVLGEGDDDELLERARAEVERRIEAGENLGDILCECWFYVGLRRERAARSAPDEERGALATDALRAHREALRFRPDTWKWEWAFARVHYTVLATELGLEGDPQFTVTDSTLTRPGTAEPAELIEARWHRVHAPRASADAPTPLRPGDLFLGRVRDPQRGPLYVRLLVEAR